MKWYNDSYGKTEFIGKYELDRAGERNFVLTNPEGKRVSFESWQSAIKNGWKKRLK